MTDASAAPPAPAAPGAPVGFDAPEAVAARETIKTRIGDKEFGAKLIAQDAAARAEWDALHKAGYPAPQRITSTEDVNNQAAARNEEG
jgi:hypothetical protein